MINETLIDFKKSLKVLLVEDNEEAREAISDLISNFFDDITTAINGKDGLEKFNSDSFDLVITDINMPIMDGIEMIKHIRETNQDISIMVLTAYQDVDFLLQSIKYSVDAYLLKPINFKELTHVVDKISTALHSLEKNRAYERHLESLVEEKTKELTELSNRDPMTNLYNRRYFNEISKTLLNIAKRDKTDLSALMIDLDRFKTINDNYGHLAGDNVLKETATLLLKSVRDSDVVIRFGGEEFVILLPSTDLDGATKIAKKIHSHIKEQKITTTNNEIIKFTLSIGIAICDRESDTNIDNLIHRSDEALYEAKRSGRDRIVIYDKENL